MRNSIFIKFSYIIVSLLLLSQFIAANNQRVVILTDIEADPDDTQSLVRLLLYSNQIDIKGLVATTSCWHQNQVDPECKSSKDLRQNIIFIKRDILLLCFIN